MRNDPISDMLTRIRNAQMARKDSVAMPSSKLKFRIAEILKKEGFILNVEKVGVSLEQSQAEKKESASIFENLVLGLKYDNKRPAIVSLKKVSKPGRRVYCKKDQLPIVLDGLGIAIISTSQGLMTNRQARRKGLGGEVICEIY
ncbi:MAG: 30S ribosomal protein S8 [Parcubacteria group bacterium]|nr:30S ribosomal protein S8 [Parcubacteria group bacterium]